VFLPGKHRDFNVNTSVYLSNYILKVNRPYLQHVVIHCYSSSTDLKTQHYDLEPDFNINPTLCISCLPRGLCSLYGIFANLSGKAGQKSQRVGNYAADVHQSERRTVVVVNNKFEILRKRLF
jgi:hypothetical protein